jgi:beta-phosphoglucomutase-like phosphatase (HAD superfamily)
MLKAYTLIDKFKNFIFDFDGTLVNSNRFHKLAFKKTLYQKKINIKNFNYENLKGLKTEDAFKKLGIKNNIKDLSKLKKEYFRKNINKIKLYKNCKKTLNYLLKNKKKIFIVSGASKKNIKNVSETSEVTINKCYKKLDKIAKDENIIPIAIVKKYNLEIK